MTAIDTIRELGRDLPIGASCMAPCPFCQAAHESKLAITRYEDGLGYVCYRASCGARGAIPLASDNASRAPRELPAKKEFKPREFTKTLQYPHGYAGELVDRIGGLPLPGRWDVRSCGPDMVHYTLRDFSYSPRGWTTRTREKKIDSGRLVDKPLYGYYTGGYMPLWMWLVEDPLSAIRLAEADQSAVALCGTHASDGLLDELWDEHPSCRRIYVALDPGAEDAARKIVTKCRYEYGLDAIQVLLPDDIHRLDSATFKTILETYR